MANPLTLERFATGKRWQEYLESGIRNRDHFEVNYRLLEISADREAKLKDLAARPGGPHHVAVIGEDWCPDVYRGLGIAQRMSEVMGIELRMFERDQNKDLIEPYLYQGEFASIPVILFFDEENREIGHFIERPALAREQMHLVHDLVGGRSPQALAAKLGREPTEDELKQARREAGRRYWEWQSSEACEAWRVATVDECIVTLEESTGD
jgi:hypothetical protein